MIELFKETMEGFTKERLMKSVNRTIIDTEQEGLADWQVAVGLLDMPQLQYGYLLFLAKEKGWHEDGLCFSPSPHEEDNILLIKHMGVNTFYTLDLIEGVIEN
jgi:hypothetical protein